MPMGLFGHLSNCSVAFAIYIHVHFYYRANEIIFIFPGLFNLKTLINSKKKNCINCIDINEQIFIKKKLVEITQSHLVKLLQPMP